MNTPVLSIIVIGHNGGDQLVRCVASIRGCVRCDHEVLLFDNASTDGSVRKALQANPAIRVIESPVNRGFSEGNNQAARQAKGEYLLLLNHDTELLDDVQPLLELMEQQRDLGVIGARMVGSDGFYRHSAGFFPSALRLLLIRSLYRRSGPFATGDFPVQPRLYPVDWVEGSFLFTRADLWQALHGLDVGYFMYVEDLDYCRRALDAGFRTVFCPAVSYLHAGGFEIGRMKWTIRGFRRYHAMHSTAPVRRLAMVLLDAGLLARVAVSGGLYLVSRETDHREKMRVCWDGLFQRKSRDDEQGTT